MTDYNGQKKENSAERYASLSFSEQVDECLKGTLKSSDIISLGEIPQWLKDEGAQGSELIITQETLQNSINPSSVKMKGHTTGHDVPVDIIKQLPELIANPVLVIRGSHPQTIVVVTDVVGRDGNNIIIPISLNAKKGFKPACKVTSAYSKRNLANYITSSFEHKTAILIEREKADKMLRSIECQSFKENTFIDFYLSIPQINRNVNTFDKNNSEINQEEHRMTSDELLKKLSEQLGANNDLVSQLINKINSLEEQLNNVTQKQEMFTEHFNQIYNAKSMEETLGIMSDLGKSDMDVESCDIYSLDTLEDKLFTVNENGERVYTDINDNTPIAAALLKNEVFIDNNYTGGEIGDSRDNTEVKNVAVIPIEAKTGEVIGVVVAKNKAQDFDKTDVDKFNLKDGKIGSAFRMGLENKALKQAAITDKLTHLHNRQGVQDYLKNVVLPSIHEGKPISTIMIDIDKFKTFNDTYGHDAGDAVLKTVAETLKAQTRNTDGVFRWGGEEMVVIANMDGAEAYELAERLRQSIENTPCDIGNGQTVSVTASMGVAQLITENPQRLNSQNIMKYFEAKPLKRADERLYNAKENGRNQVVASPNVMKQAEQRREQDKSQDRRKPSVLGSIKNIRNEEQSKPIQQKQEQQKTNQKKDTSLE